MPSYVPLYSYVLSLPENSNLIFSCVPSRITFWAFSESFSHGVLSLNLYFFASVWIWRRRQCSEPSFHRAMAPSSIDFEVSGMILRSSISRSTPRPEQPLHAPYGELKEKRRGVISPMETPQSGHAYDCDISSSRLSSW